MSTQRRHETATTAKPQRNAVYKAATGLHTEIQRVHTQITHLSDTVEENREQIRNVTEDQCFAPERIQKLEYEIEKLESYSRRNNLRFFNISSRQTRLTMTTQGLLYKPSTSSIPQNGGVKIIIIIITFLER